MRYIYFFLIFFTISYAVPHTDTNLSDILDRESINNQIATYKEAIDTINKDLKGNIWLTRFSNFITYQRLLLDLEDVDTRLKQLNKNNTSKVKILEKKQRTLERQLELLGEFKRSPFAELVKPPVIIHAPKISNPIAIIGGFSYIKQLQSEQRDFKERLIDLDNIIEKLQTKQKLLNLLSSLDPSLDLEKEMSMLERELNEFSSARDISKTTYKVHSKKVDESIAIETNEITNQIKKAFNIAIFIVIVILLSFMFKFFAKKYIKDNVRFYMSNKVINFINVALIILILLFAYIENVTYLVTVLGFASAGIAIAMKDMFMSLLGWMVIVFGGSFHVGDRIKVKKEGLPYVGDIIDISLLRMTILEDITYTTYRENRRSGRVIFVPNNYIFTGLIANYTHITLKTVWDGIDITITFDSNYKKAMYLIKNLTKKYSKGYTDIARKQLNMLRHQYSLKNTNVEPRIYSFLEPHGLTISTWYMTNSYAALTLRSTLSAEIIQAINNEDDITIAYPTQTLHVNSRENRNIPLDINKDVLF